MVLPSSPLSKRPKIDPGSAKDKDQCRTVETTAAAAPLALSPTLAGIPDCPLDNILSYASADLGDLGRLSQTCRRLRRSCDDFAWKLFGAELPQPPPSSCSDDPGRRSRLGRPVNTPLDWSWPGRLAHLRTRGCLGCGGDGGGPELFVYGHWSTSTLVGFARLDELIGEDYPADLTTEDRNQIKPIMSSARAGFNARLGGRLMTGRPFAVWLRGGMSQRAREVLLEHLMSGGSRWSRRWSCSRPLMLDTREVLLIVPGSSWTTATDNIAMDEFRIPSHLLPADVREGGGECDLAKEGTVYTFRTKLRRLCWDCDCPIKDGLGACDECVFEDEEDNEHLKKLAGHARATRPAAPPVSFRSASFVPINNALDRFKKANPAAAAYTKAIAESDARAMRFSSDPERARKMAEEEGKEDGYEPIVILEMLSSSEKGATVLAVAEVVFENGDNVFGVKAGPTLQSILSVHDEHEAMLKYFIMWSEVIFPPPSELQVTSSALSKVPGGKNLLIRHNWVDSNGEGDYVVTVGQSKASEDDLVDDDFEDLDAEVDADDLEDY